MSRSVTVSEADGTRPSFINRSRFGRSAQNAHDSIISSNLNERHSPKQSLAATLALANYDVYRYSPRRANLAPNACSGGAIDCSVLKDWNFNTYLSEIDYIRHQVHRDRHEEQAIGALSIGGMLGVVAVNSNPSGYCRLRLWVAILSAADPVITSLNTVNCANLNGTIAAGIYYEEGLTDLVKQLVQMGIMRKHIGLFFRRSSVVGSGQRAQLDRARTRISPLMTDNFRRISLSLVDRRSGRRSYEKINQGWRGFCFAIKSSKYGPMNDSPPLPLRERSEFFPNLLDLRLYG
jgi:hypothetical protein